MQQHDEVTLRFAREDDLAGIHRLILELADYEKLAHTVVATSGALRDMLFGKQPAAEVVLAELAGEPVGFALFYQNISTFRGCRGLFLEDVYVRPEHRGRGIGKQFLRELARIARQRGWGMIEWRVLDWNEPAIRFYRSIGAEALDDWTVFRVTGEAMKGLAAPNTTMRDRHDD